MQVLILINIIEFVHLSFQDDFCFNLWERLAKPLYEALVDLLRGTKVVNMTAEELLSQKPDSNGEIDLRNVSSFVYDTRYVSTC